MSQSPALAWETAPADVNQQRQGATDAPVVEAKVEDFDAAVERVARDQIFAIKASTDQTRLNAAVGERVAVLVKELGLPSPKTEDENIETLTQSKLEEFEMQRLHLKAEQRARDIFFDRHPELKTHEKKQNVEGATAAMSEALMGAFLRFLRDEQQADQRREAREAARKKP